ncbi:MAG: DUF6690 family protein [Bythopirellula sp.]
MFSRIFSVPLLLGAAVAVPYVASNGPNIDKLFGDAAKTPFAGSPQRSPSPGSVRSDLPPIPQGPGATLYPTATPLEGLPALSLQEVFNFNVTKEWVYQRWPRKSTALSELGSFGIRVPLVTGTQIHDLAGSLTYFFDKVGRVQRISFHGTTGDTSQIVMLVARGFGLQQQSTAVAGEQLFQARRNDQIFSELRTRPAPVLWASSPHESFAVDLDLQGPNATNPLPSRLPSLPDVQVQQQSTAAQQSAAAEEAQQAAAAKKAKSKASWKAFFPRSRVPKQQTNGLQRSSELW